MPRHAWLVSLVLIIAVSSTPAAPVPAPANKSVPIPTDALAVLQIRGVDTLREHYAVLLKAAFPDIADKLLADYDRGLNAELDGRDLTLLRPNQRIYWVVTHIEDLMSDTPSVAMLLPVQSYKSFRTELLTADERSTFVTGRIDQFTSYGKTVYAIDLTEMGYVAVTTNEDTARVFAGKFKPLDFKTNDPGVSETFLASDASVFLNMTALNDRYGDQIRNIRQLATFAMQAGNPATGGISQKQREQLKLLIDGLFQTVQDSNGLAIGVVFRSDGLMIRGEIGFVANTPVSSVLSAETPIRFPELIKLPSGQSTYVAGRTSTAVSTILAQLSSPFTAADDDEATTAVIDQYLQLLAKSDTNGFRRAGSGLAGSITMTTPKKPKTLVEAQLAVFEQLPVGAEYLNVIIREKPQIKRAAQRLAGFELHQINLNLDFEATVKSITDDNLRDTTIASMKRFVAEKPIIWFGTDGTRIVELSAPDWPTAKRLLEAALADQSPLERNTSFSQVLRMLPAESSLLVVMDVERNILQLRDLVADSLESVPGLPVRELPELKPSGGPATFFGLSVALKPRSARVDIYCPVEAIKTGRSVLEPAFGK